MKTNIKLLSIIFYYFIALLNVNYLNNVNILNSSNHNKLAIIESSLKILYLKPEALDIVKYI